MFNYSKISRHRLASCHIDLQNLFFEVLEHYDHSILCGHRGREEQEALFNVKPQRTKLQYPHSKHNKLPAMAVDVAPYPIKWDNEHSNRFYCFAGFVLGVASQLKKQGVTSHDIRWGGDWDGDQDFSDQNFNDLVHFELISNE